MKHLLIVLLLATTLSSCFYESEVPLVGPHEPLPESLIGHWLAKPDKDELLLRIENAQEGATKNQGYIIVNEGGGEIDNNEQLPLLFSSITIGNTSLIQVSYYDKEEGKTNYFFSKFEQKGKYLYIYLVQDDLFRADGIVKQFSTSDSLQQEILRLISEDGFYTKKPMKFTKQ